MKKIWNIQTKAWLLILATTLPFLWLFENMPWEIWGEEFFWVIFSFHAASVLGYIGTVLIFWEFVLGTRPISSFFTPDILTLNSIHAKIGKYGILCILTHPLLEMYTYGQDISWLALFDISTETQMHITFGRVALLLFMLIWLTSAVARASIKYRPWKYIHYLTYPLMAMVLLHMRDIGTNLERYPILGALWICAAAGFAVLVLLRILQTTWALSKKYSVVSIKTLPGDMTSYTCKPLGGAIAPAIGQFIYIQTKRFGEAHPFSVMEFNPATNEITFGIKTVGRFSQKLKNLKQGDTISLEGPFGVFTKEGHNNHPKVIIAGGAGVTPFIELMKHYGDNSILLNCNKTLADVIYRNQLKNLLGTRYYDFVTREQTQIKDSQVITERINAAHIARINSHHSFEQPNFFVCGSPQFIKGIEQVLFDELHISKDRVYIEKFSL